MYRGFKFVLLFWSTVIAQRFGFANMKFEFAVQDVIKNPKLKPTQPETRPFRERAMTCSVSWVELGPLPCPKRGKIVA